MKSTLLRVPIHPAQYLGQKANALDSLSIIGDGQLIATYTGTGNMSLHQVVSWEEKTTKEIVLESTFGAPRFVKAHYPYIVTLVTVGDLEYLQFFCVEATGSKASYYTVPMPKGIGDAVYLAAEGAGVYVITSSHLTHFPDYEKGKGDASSFKLADVLEYKITQVSIHSFRMAIVMGRRVLVVDSRNGKTIRSHLSDMPIHHVAVGPEYLVALSADLITIVALNSDVIHTIHQTPSPSCLHLLDETVLARVGTISHWILSTGENICRLYTNETSEVDQLNVAQLKSKAIFRLSSLAGFAICWKIHSVSIFSLSPPYTDKPVQQVECPQPLMASNFVQFGHKMQFRVHDQEADRDELWSWTPDLAMLHHLKAAQMETVASPPSSNGNGLNRRYVRSDNYAVNRKLHTRKRSQSNPVAPSALADRSLPSSAADAAIEDDVSQSRSAASSASSGSGLQLVPHSSEEVRRSSKSSNERSRKLFRSKSPKEPGSSSGISAPLPMASMDDSSIALKSKRNAGLRLNPRETKEGGRSASESDQYFSIDYYRQSYENLKKVCKLLQARDDENRRIIAEMAERISELERLVAVQGNEIEELSGDPSSSKKSHRRSREIKPLAVIDEKVHQNKPSHHHEGGERRAEREKSRDKDNETSPDHTSNSSRERGSSRSSSGGKR